MAPLPFLDLAQQLDQAMADIVTKRAARDAANTQLTTAQAALDAAVNRGRDLRKQMNQAINQTASEMKDNQP